MSAAVELGTGVLTWNRMERVSDRYGAVYLISDGATSLNNVGGQRPWLARVPEGTVGVLRATVLEARESTHIGDFFRGIYPSTPEVGEVIDLGTGAAFYGPRKDGYEPFGLAPSDDRESDWLDPRALYRCHEQTVRLDFIPAD